MNFRYPPAGGSADALRFYLRSLVSELNAAAALLSDRQEKFSSDAALSVTPETLPSLPAGITPEDFEAGGYSAVRMGKNILLAAGNRLFLGAPEGEELNWTLI